MKRIFRKIVKPKKSKHSSLTINDALGSSSEPATSTSTIETSTAGPMPSVPANAAAASTQVIQVAGVTAAHLVSTSVSALAINEQDVGIPIASVTHLTIVIDQAAHNLLSTSVPTWAINDPAPVCIPAAGVNSAHELQASPSVSALAVAPAAHLEGNSPSPHAVMQAKLGSIESQQNLSAQQSSLGLLANAQNTFITGGTFNNVIVLPANTDEAQMKIPVPKKPNSSPIFTGRKDILYKLGKIFVHRATSRLMSRRSCLLWGLGGIGKTQICLKFIEEMSDM
ncbi:hypothetical protein BYT27DRAFT_7189123 [Phlegmacium glaucopus]|nr:hypothetical protein BYT27DRAFT_7189123 [Phlegmacium glaucopus]